MDKLNTVLYDSSLAIVEQDTSTIEAFSSLQNYYRVIAPYDNSSWIAYGIFYPTNVSDNVGIAAEPLYMRYVGTDSSTGETLYVYEREFPDAVVGSSRATKIDVTVAFIAREENLVGVSFYDVDTVGYNETTFIAAQLLLDYGSATIAGLFTNVIPTTNEYIRSFNTETDWIFNGTAWVDSDDVTVTYLEEHRADTVASYALRKGISTGRPTHAPDNTFALTQAVNDKINSTEAYANFYTKTDVDTRYVNVTGDDMSGTLDMNTNLIIGVDTPTANDHAANKLYVDTREAVLQADIDAIETNIDVIEAEIDVIDTDQITQNGRLTVNEGDIDDLETEQALQAGRLTVNETDIDNLETAIVLKAPQSTTYTKVEVDDLVSSVYKFQGSVATYTDLAAKEGTAVIGDVWNVTDTGINFAWTGTVWDDIGGIEALASATNDGLMSQEDFSKLATIETNAELNIIEVVKVNGIAESITAKAIDIFVPDKTSEIENDGNGSSVYVTANDLGNAGFGDMTELEYATNGEVGITDEAVLSRASRQTIIVDMTYDTAGKFYATVDSYVLTANYELTLLFPNTLTDLSTNVSISLTGISGTYKDLVYDDTENNVIVSHTQDLKTDVYYDSVQFMMKGEPLLPLDLTFDSSVNSTYGLGKPIKGISTIKEIDGLLVNQVVVNGGFPLATTGWSTISGTTLSIVSETLRSTTTAVNINNGIKLSSSPLMPNTDYIIKYKIKPFATHTALIFMGRLLSTGITVTANIWNEVSYVFNSSTLGDTTFAIYSNGKEIIGANIGDVVDFDDIMLIPITNTPLASKTASEIDNIVTEYIEGINYISNPSYQSVGVNLYNIKSTITEHNIDSYSISDNSLNIIETVTAVAGVKQDVIVIPNTTYILSGTVTNILGSNGRIRITNSEETFVTQFIGSDVSFNVGDTSYLTFDFQNGVDTAYNVTYTDLQLEQGTVATPYTPYNTDTFSLTDVDLLSVGTSIRDVAYLDNGDWFKDAYVGIALAVAIDDVIDTTAIPTILETTGVFYAVDTVNNENQYGVYGDTLTLTGTATVYFQLATIVNSELEYTGALIQESTTTLIQSSDNGLATEYDIEFALNHKAQTALHSEMLKGLRDDIDENSADIVLLDGEWIITDSVDSKVYRVNIEIASGVISLAKTEIV